MENGSILKDLKAILLSIDWEITEEVMDRLIGEVSALKRLWQGEEIHGKFLQLLESLGSYIRKRKAGTHPDSVRVLQSVFHGLERIVQEPEMNRKEKQELLLSEIARFQELKRKIVQSHTGKGKTAPTGKIAEDAARTLASRIDGMPPHEAFAVAVEELKKTIRAEFRALRAELDRQRSRQ